MQGFKQLPAQRAVLLGVSEQTGQAAAQSCGKRHREHSGGNGPRILVAAPWWQNNGGLLECVSLLSTPRGSLESTHVFPNKQAQP